MSEDEGNYLNNEEVEMDVNSDDEDEEYITPNKVNIKRYF